MNIKCPNCSTVHQVPDSIRGKTVRCNNCGATFVATDASAPARAGTAPIPPAAQAQPVQAAPGPPPGPVPAAPAPGYAGPGAPPEPKRGWFATMKLKLRAARLRRQARGLNRAIEDQWEKLGVLVLQQRPAGLDVNPELTELGQIQNTLADRQNTLATLKGTQGSRAVVKEVQQEMAQLQNRQRDVVLGVGRKADSARIDMPNAALHYTAIDRLRQTLANGESELAQLQEQLGTEGAAISPGKLLKPVLIGAGAIVVVVVVVIVLLKVLTGGGWKAYADYIPEDLVAFTVTDLATVRESELEDELVDEMPWGESEDINLSIDDIQQVVTVRSEDDGEVLLLYTRKNQALDKVFEDLDDEEDYRDYKYAKASAKIDLGGFERSIDFYVAKTGSGLYCIAQRESELKAALKRLDEGEKPELKEEMFLVLDAVDSYDNYRVREGGGPFLGSEDTRAVGYGFSAGTSFSFTGINVFRRESRAEDTVEEFTDALKELDEEPDSDDIDEKDWKRVLTMLRGIAVTQDGNTVRFSASWSADDAKLLFEVREKASEWGELGSLVRRAQILP